MEFANHLAKHSDDDSVRLLELVTKYQRENQFFYDPDLPPFGFTKGERNTDALRLAANRYMIIRDIPKSHTYLTHWLAIFISSDLITPTSLLFQELDALSAQILSFPS